MIDSISDRQNLVCLYCYAQMSPLRGQIFCNIYCANEFAKKQLKESNNINISQHRKVNNE